MKAAEGRLEEQPAEGGGSPRRRERLGEAWALRAAFLRVALAAVAVRLALIVLCGLLPSASREPSAYVLEALACALPFVWCAVSSRPPPGHLRFQAGVADRAAYFGVCLRLPRFTFFSAATVLLEFYSTVAAAWSLVMAPCGASPWQVVLPYCLGVAVAVVRSYSAILALRLQDELAHACVQVLPVSPKSSLEGALAIAVASKDAEVRGEADAQEGGFELDFRCPAPPPRRPGCNAFCVEPHDEPEEPDEPKPVATPLGAGEEEPLRQSGRCRRSFSGLIRRWLGGLACRASSDGTSCRKRLLQRRTLLRLGLVGVLLSATSSIWIIHSATGGKQEKAEPASSCTTAQNSTATCAHFALTGTSLLDLSSPELMMDVADSLQDCCRGCDAVGSCQAWIYERVGRRCRWIRFLEDPCLANPGALECRCLTHRETAFGFKPVGKIVWMQRSL